MTRNLYRAAIVLLILTAVFTGQGAMAQTPETQSAQAEPAPLTGLIAYPVYDPDRGTYDIYVASADGINRQVVLVRASAPALGPGCIEIAFRSWIDDGRGVFIRDVSGGQRRRLTEQAFVEDTQPKWSPDYETLAFASRRETDRDPRVYLAEAGGGVDRPLSSEGETVTGNTPNWLPDGRLVFNTCLGNDCGLVVMNENGTGALSISDHTSDRSPDASPDGSSVVFMSERDGNWEIYRVPAEGGEPVRLTENPANDGLPVWSPDGGYIAFVSDRGGRWGMWIMEADGTAQQELWELEGPLDSDLPGHGWLDESISWELTGPPPGQAAGARWAALGDPCDVTLLEPEQVTSAKGEPIVRFTWQLDRPLESDEYYMLFAGVLQGDVSYVKGSFWDPVLEAWGPWGLDTLETMAPILEVLHLRDEVFETLMLESDDGEIHWEVQVRTMGQDDLDPSPFDPVVCKKDGVLSAAR